MSIGNRWSILLPVKFGDAVGDARCGFPINTNYTLLHLTGNYKKRRRSNPYLPKYRNW